MALDNPVLEDDLKLPDMDMEMPSASDVLKSVQETKLGMLDEVSKLLEGKGKEPVQAPKPTAKTAAHKPTEQQQQKPQSRIPGPPTEDAPEPKEDDEPSRDYSQARNKPENWKKIHALRDAAEAKVKDLDAKIKSYEEKLKTATLSPEIQKRLELAEKQRDEYLSTIEAVAAERSPRFQQQFKPRIDSAIKLAIQQVDPAHAEKVAQLLSMPDSEYRNQQLEAISQDLSGMRAGKFVAAVSEMDKIHNERAEFASRGQEAWKAWTQESQAQQQRMQAESQSKLLSAFEAEASDWANVDSFKIKTVDEDHTQAEIDAHNQGVSERLELAKKIYSGGLNARELARATLWAAIAPDVTSKLKVSEGRVAELEKELQSLRGAEPTPGGDGGELETDEPVTKGISAGTAIGRIIAKSGLLR